MKIDKYFHLWAEKNTVHFDEVELLAIRLKGKWTDSEGKERIKSKYCGHCSVCGGWSEYLTDFCGNCGADMRGDTE